MTTIKQTNQRSSERRMYGAPIRLTHFNGGQWLEAQTLNHCTDGMCVKANVRFQPGTAILIRVEHRAWNDSCTCTHEGLPAMTLGEVKWCREIPEAAFAAYEVGVKYYAPYY